jgi:hypothetical protein
MRRGCAQPFASERVAHLLSSSTEVPERPEQLDVVVANCANRCESTIGIRSHSSANRIQLEADTIQPLRRECPAWRCSDADSSGGDCLNEIASIHHGFGILPQFFIWHNVCQGPSSSIFGRG